MLKPSLILAACLPAILLLPLRGADAGQAVPASQAPDTNPASVADEFPELARLHALPAEHVPLKGATLASAIRLLAQSGRMSYISPAEADFGERITSDVMMNPFDLLQVLGDDYGFSMEFTHGVWRFYRINLNELVSKSYTIRFDNLQRVTIQSTSINSQLASAGGGMTSMGGGSPGGGLGGSTPSSGAPRNGTFNSKTDQIIEDIKKILGLPTVGVSTPSLENSSDMPGAGADRKGQEAPKVEPIWNPDTSTLFVVATRQQHSLIAAYLKAIDRPQQMVRIAVKFVETSRNPQQALGADWSQTFLGSGGPLSLSGQALTSAATTLSNVPGSAGSNGTTITTTSGTTSTSVSTGSSGSGSPASTLATTLGLGKYLPNMLLSGPAFSLTLQAINSDICSSIVQDPVIYTTNNHEVTFKDTTQEPIQQGTTTIGSATAATTSSIAYIDVGTVVNVLPTILPGRGAHKEIIQLSLSIEVSSITGTQTIGGNPYPITSSRSYSYSVAVPVGETLAIAGLEQRSRQTTQSKVPLFGDIPIIGYAFKNKNDSTIRTTLLAFITPELVRTDDPAVAAVPLPQYHHRVFLGSDTETIKDIDQSLDGMPSDIDALQKCACGANKDAVLNRLGQIEVELSLIDVRLGEIRLSEHLTGSEANLVASDREKLDTVRTSVSTLKVN
jgi:Flp pilus assembly secretin CpaC